MATPSFSCQAKCLGLTIDPFYTPYPECWEIFWAPLKGPRTWSCLPSAFASTLVRATIISHRVVPLPPILSRADRVISLYGKTGHVLLQLKTPSDPYFTVCKSSSPHCGQPRPSVTWRFPSPHPAGPPSSPTSGSLFFTQRILARPPGSGRHACSAPAVFIQWPFSASFPNPLHKIVVSPVRPYPLLFYFFMSHLTIKHTLYLPTTIPKIRAPEGTDFCLFYSCWILRTQNNTQNIIDIQKYMWNSWMS